MALSLAVWSLALKPGDGVELLPPADLRIVNAALGDEIADEASRSSLRLIYSGPSAGDSEDEDEEDDEKLAPTATVLCSLTPGKIEQATLDVILEGGQAVAFENTGKNTIHITGNFIDQVRLDEPPSEDELGLPEDEEEEAVRLEDVSSDVEVEADGLADDEEEDVPMEEPEPKEQPKKAKSKKHGLDSEEKEESAPSKSEKKKLKKLKGQNGEAIPVEDKEAQKEQAPSEKKEKKKDKQKEKEKQGEAGAKSESVKGVREVTGGVKVQDIKPGNGEEAKKGHTVRMRYVGKLDDGSIFDSNTKGKPFEFTLGDGDVIKGWDVGIPGMKEGGKRLLVIPPSMGYGKRKQSGIPPSSTLTFEVTLVKIVS